MRHCRADKAAQKITSKIPSLHIIDLGGDSVKYSPVIIFILAVSLTAAYICFADECAGIRQSASEIIEAGLDYEKTAECMGRLLRGRGGDELKAVIEEFIDFGTMSVSGKVRCDAANG